MPHEVYPRAPVQFVSLRVRFPVSPVLQRLEGKEAVYQRVAAEFPLLETLAGGGLQFQFGAAAVGPEPEVAAPRQLRMMNRERTHSFTLGPRMLLYECTDHVSFDTLLEIVRPVFDALVEVAAPAGLDDVMLKYVDEIRHPTVNALGDWHGLIADSLLGPVGLRNEDPEQTSGVAVYKLTDHQELRAEYGGALEGFVVDPNGPLKVVTGGSGPFFRLNFEAEWTTPAEAVPPFELDHVFAIVDELHEPIRGVFESAISAELRDYFRGNDVAGSG